MVMLGSTDSGQGSEADTYEPNQSQPTASSEDVQRLRKWARVVLIPVGLIGAALSFASIYEAALETFGPVLSAGVPILVDFLILGASLMYIAGAKVGRPRAGWRLTAHAAVAGTLLLNAMASPDLAHLPWHVVAPAVWSVLVEMSAREVLGEWRAVHSVPADRIPLALWVSAPIESARTALHMMRTGTRSAAVARRQVGVNAAARRIMRKSLPRGSGATRAALRRQLRAGSLDPVTLVRAVGWHPGDPSYGSDAISRAAAERAALVAVVTGIIPESTPPSPSPDVRIASSASDDTDATGQLDAPDEQQPKDPTAGEAQLQRQVEGLREQVDAALLETTRLRQEAEAAQAARAEAEAKAQAAEEEVEARQRKADQLAEAMDRIPFAVLHLAAELRHRGDDDIDLNGSDVALRYGVPPRTGRRWLNEARTLLAAGIPAPDIADNRPLRSAATP